MKKIFIISIVFASILSGFGIAKAQNQIEYQLLAPIPCVGSDQNGDCKSVAQKATFESYVEGGVKFLIGLAGAIAVVRIVWGGFLYMSTDAVLKKSEGKALIKNSLLGLLLVMAAFVLLFTINPKLFSFDLNIESVSIAPPAGGSLGAGQTQRETQLAYDALKSQCTGCNIRVTSTTGGQHTPGSDHYKGLAMDFGADPNLTKFITGSTNTPDRCATIPKTLNGQSVTFLWEPKGARCSNNPNAPASDGDHWHMSVRQ